MALSNFFGGAGSPTEAFSRRLNDAMDPGGEIERNAHMNPAPYSLRYPLTVGTGIAGNLNYNSNLSSKHAITRVNEGIDKEAIEPFVFFEFMEIKPKDKTPIPEGKGTGHGGAGTGGIKRTAEEIAAQESAISQVEYALIGNNSKPGNARLEGKKPGDLLSNATKEAKESGLLKPALRRYKGSIAMYMPTDIQFNDTIQYNENSRRIFGIMQGLGSGDIDSENIAGSLIGPMSAAAGLGIGKLSTFVGKFFGGSVGDTIASQGTGAGGLLGAAGAGVIADEYQRSTGKATNPHEYMAYQNTGLRSFTYTFTFLPDSKQESDEVTEIIKEFRHAAHADRIDSLKVTVPEHVIISHHGAGDMIQLPPLVIESVNVSYNPNNSSFFFEGNNPVEVGLSITFREIVPLFKKDIEGGF